MPELVLLCCFPTHISPKEKRLLEWYWAGTLSAATAEESRKMLNCPFKFSTTTDSNTHYYYFSINMLCRTQNYFTWPALSRPIHPSLCVPSIVSIINEEEVPAGQGYVNALPVISCSGIITGSYTHAYLQADYMELSILLISFFTLLAFFFCVPGFLYSGSPEVDLGHEQKHFFCFAALRGRHLRYSLSDVNYTLYYCIPLYFKIFSLCTSHSIEPIVFPLLSFFFFLSTSWTVSAN